MTRSELRQGVVVIAALAAGLAQPAGAGVPGPGPLVLVNESQSVPRGLYLRALDPSVRPGAIVALGQPPAVRPYLRALGMPAAVVLLKRVAARPGDRVCAEPSGLAWPGGRVHAFANDRRGVPLPHWQGCRVLAAGELLVLGDTASSFDSRYFGPVPRAAVQGVYVEMLQW